MRRSFQPPRVVAISSGRARPGSAWRVLEPWFEHVATLQPDAVHLREKALPDRELLEVCRRGRAILPEPVALILAQRPDLANAGGASGVHLPASGLPAGQVRRAFPELSLAVSTHSVTEVWLAAEAGADYVYFGPVFATPEKVRYGPAQGLAALAEASGQGLPVLAVGGIDSRRLAAVHRAGAAGVAAIRWFSSHEVDRALDLETDRAAEQNLDRDSGREDPNRFGPDAAAAISRLWPVRETIPT